MNGKGTPVGAFLNCWLREMVGGRGDREVEGYLVTGKGNSPFLLLFSPPATPSPVTLLPAAHYWPKLSFQKARGPVLIFFVEEH